MAQSEEIKLNSTGPKNFKIFFCVVFRCYSQSLTCGRETGHWALPPTNVEILLIFPSFHRSATRQATCIKSLVTGYQV